MVRGIEPFIARVSLSVQIACHGAGFYRFSGAIALREQR
jgi:hypothetical protein